MIPATEEKIQYGLNWACVSFAVWFTLAFVFVACMSMSYPFHLEWMEGQVIDIVARIRAGKSVYVEPSIDYVSFAYTPLYYYVVAFVSFFTGVDFFPARLVSFLSALGIGGVIYAWIRKEGGNWMQGFIAAGLFFATYKLSGRWFDNSRVDSLFLLQAMGAMYVFYHHRGWKYEILTAILLTAAFFTKQSALIIATPPMLAFLFLERTHALRVLAMWGAMVLAVCLVYNSATNGWFNFFVFELESGHGIQQQYVSGFWFNDLFKHVGILFALAAFLVSQCWFDDRAKTIRYVALAAGCVGCSYASRLNWGGYFNVIMPAHAVLALFAGLALVYFEKTKTQMPMFISWLLLFQMFMIVYNPMQLIPTEESRAKGEAFLQQIKNIDGDVFMPELQWVQTRVGKKSYTLGMAAFDLISTDLKEKNDIRDKFRREVNAAVAHKQFAAVIPGRLINGANYEQYYEFQQHVEYPQEYITGATNFLPSGIFMRIPDANAPAATPQE